MNNSMLYKKKRPLVLFLIPATLLMIIFLYYPFLSNFFNAFRTYGSGITAQATGWQDPWFSAFWSPSYSSEGFYSGQIPLLQDPAFLAALKNTGILVLAAVFLQVGLSLVLSLLVDNVRHGASVYRTIYFFPIVISATALGLFFQLLFKDYGPIQHYLTNVPEGNALFTDEKHYLLPLLISVVWQYVGFYFVIIATGLNNISADLYEAASIDGASNWQVVWYLKIPLLRNTINSCILLAATGALKVYDMPNALFPAITSNTPWRWTLGTLMYERAYTPRINAVSTGAAIAVVIVVLGILLSGFINLVCRDKDY
ncbi:MAG: sugar ABC transporter permease [Oscillospiraceae bacterium]|jgi:raffinose/stachyose/melibiose transport system permease protein|nr:sugar ABC transporter permease [Oscillospiraceae bacterium]